MKRKMGNIRTDQQGVVPQDILNDASMKRIQAKMELRRPVSFEGVPKLAQAVDEEDRVALIYGGNFKIYKDLDPTGEKMKLGVGAEGEVVAITPDGNEALVDFLGDVVEVPLASLRKISRKMAAKKVLKFASLDQIPKDFTPLGTGMYRKGHSLWRIDKEGDSFVLVRTAEEKFDEDKVAQQAQPGSIDPKTFQSLPQNIQDEIGIKPEPPKQQPAAPAQPQPPTTGTPGNYPGGAGNVNQQEQLKHVEGRRASRKVAVDSTAKDYYKKLWPKGYGKALTENKLDLIAPIIARAFFKMMGRTIPAHLADRQPQWSRIAKKYGNGVAMDIRQWMADGMTQARIAAGLGVTTRAALAWKPVVDMVGMERAASLRREVMGGRPRVQLVASHTKKAVEMASSAARIERVASRSSKVAVDEAAKDYYRRYYKSYGEELVKDVREIVNSAPKAAGLTAY